MKAAALRWCAHAKKLPGLCLRWKGWRGAAHTLIAGCSLVAVGYGFWLAWEPLGPIVVGGLLLAGVIYARTR